MPFVRFASHRAREYGLRELARQPPAFFSLRRPRTHYGIYDLTEAEIAQLREVRFVRFTRLRGPFDDLGPCWPS